VVTISPLPLARRITALTWSGRRIRCKK
jgi:hypothetical protein